MPTDREYELPSGGTVEETGTRQEMIPGADVSETASATPPTGGPFPFFMDELSGGLQTLGMGL